MSRKQTVQKLERTMQALAAAPPPSEAPASPSAEPEQLVRELAKAFAEQLDQYRKGSGAGRPDPGQPPPEWSVENLRTMPAHDLHFGDLERLAKVDPAAAAERWEEVKAAARRELDSGFRAGRALEPMGGSAWERASFLALRDRLRRAWPPRHDGEALLIDEIAQYETLRLRWLGLLATRSNEPRVALAPEPRGEGEALRRNAVAAAANDAVRMVERLQRLAHGALRLLTGLRRSQAPLIFRGAGSVNVAVGQQLNVNAPLAEGVPPSQG